jgi:phage I-like protein
LNLLVGIANQDQAEIHTKQDDVMSLKIKNLNVGQFIDKEVGVAVYRLLSTSQRTYIALEHDLSDSLAVGVLTGQRKITAGSYNMVAALCVAAKDAASTMSWQGAEYYKQLQPFIQQSSDNTTKLAQDGRY